MEIQTRSESKGLRQFHSFEEAFHYANSDPTCWKISFTVPETGERVRLVKNGTGYPYRWIYEPIQLREEN